MVKKKPTAPPEPILMPNVEEVGPVLNLGEKLKFFFEDFRGQVSLFVKDLVSKRGDHHRQEKEDRQS